MRVRALLALVASALAASPAAASVSVSGNLGAGYSAANQWRAIGSSETHVLDLDGDVNLSSPIFPGLLVVDAGAFYYGSRRGGDSTSRSDSWGYRLSLAAMGDSEHPVNLSATRQYNEFTSSGSNHTGTTVTTNYSAVAQYVPPAAPNLRAVVSRVETDNHSFGAPDVRAETTTLSLAVNQSAKDLWYLLQYDTGWNTGTYAETNYRNHNVLAQTELSVTPELRVAVNGGYQLRDPTLVSPLNPRYDSQALTTSVILTPTPAIAYSAGYGYANYLTTIPGEAARSQTTQTASASHNRPLGEHTTMSVNAAVTVADVAAAAGARHSTGEQIGASASWNNTYQKLNVFFTGNGSVSALQVPGRSGQGGYGIGFGTGLGSTFGDWSTSASYSASWSSNLGGVEATAFSHSLGFNASGPSLARGRLLATLTLGGRRSDAAILGTTGGRSLRFNATSTWQDMTITLQAGVDDGLSEALKGPGGGDGLFLPLDYNTHTRYLVLQGQRGFGDLNVSGILRHLEIVSPGQGAREETAVGARLGYVLGAFTFGFEDTVTWISGPQGGATGNVVFLRVTRSFGTVFGY